MRSSIHSRGKASTSYAVWNGCLDEVTVSRALRILIADDEPEMLAYLEESLTLLGHCIVGSVASGHALVDSYGQLHPDLVITDIRMPDMDGLEAANQIWDSRSVPVIIISGHNDPDLIARAERAHVLGYLVKPIKHADLQPAITIAMRRFEEYNALQLETQSLRRTLEERKLIERAKGILMRRANLSDEAAGCRLEQFARDQNRAITAIAQMIVTAEEAMQPARPENLPSRKPPGRRRRRHHE